MSTINASVISCGACQRQFSWKPELAGKRVKCKCGEKISVPAPVAGKVSASTPTVRKSIPAPVKKPKVAPPSDPADLDGLLALAEDADRAAAALPIEVMEFPPEPVVELLPKSKAAKKNSNIPLGYQRGPSAREKSRAAEAAAALVDPVRDLYAPLAILGIGLALYIGYFIFKYHLGSGAIMPVGIGVVILTVIKAALLIGFALVAAGPLGVSFGEFKSAILKLAAIAVFTDGAIAWVDFGVGRIAGGTSGGGVFSWGVVGFPVALGMYWGLLIYLFSMDPGDSWMVVALLSVFDRIMRWVLLAILLETVLSWGGVAMPAAAGLAAKNKTSIHASALSTEVDDLKQSDSLIEAKKYIDDGHQGVLKQPTIDWYAAGCPNVWFAMSGRDINGRRSATGVIVELPQDKTQRARCYDILQKYYKDTQVFSDPSFFKDTGEDYLQVMIQ
jgi:hypothetical protein